MTEVIDAPLQETLESFSSLDRAPRRAVLIVDDDEAVRGMIGLALEHLGCEVWTAAGAEEALQIVSGCPVLDLVITDIRMPRLSGIDLAERLRALHPEVRLVYCTGASHHSLEEWGIEEGCFLQKPVTLASLQAVLRSLWSD